MLWMIKRGSKNLSFFARLRSALPPLPLICLFCKIVCHLWLALCTSIKTFDLLNCAVNDRFPLLPVVLYPCEQASNQKLWVMANTGADSFAPQEPSATARGPRIAQLFLSSAANYAAVSLTDLWVCSRWASWTAAWRACQFQPPQFLKLAGLREEVANLHCCDLGIAAISVQLYIWSNNMCLEASVKLAFGHKVFPFLCNYDSYCLSCLGRSRCSSTVILMYIFEQAGALAQ